MERGLGTGLRAEPLHKDQRRATEPTIGARIDDVQSAYASQHRDLRGVEDVSARGAPDQALLSPTRREQALLRLDLHDRAIPELRDAAQQGVVSEYGA